MRTVLKLRFLWFIVAEKTVLEKRIPFVLGCIIGYALGNQRNVDVLIYITIRSAGNITKTDGD